MRKFILPILLLHLAVAVNAATYYFSSSSGDDSRSTWQAQDPSTPWQSIAKLNSIMYLLQPGDQVLFNSSDTFLAGSAGINVTASGITFGSYGSGSQPVISGFSIVTNWTQVRSNVWQSPFWQPNGLPRMVIRNNQQQGIGRYPNLNAANGGYLNIDANDGSTQITSNSLPSSPNWTGADIVVRKNHWSLDRTTISSQSGQTLTFAAGSTPIVGNNYGFFIVNSTNTLDQDGEWFYNKNGGGMQMYFNGNNPNNYTVQASTVETLVNIGFQNYITFNNLSFQGANSYAFNLTHANNITVNNCNVNFTGIDAVNAISCNYFTLSNSTISNTNNNGANLYWNCNYTVIQNDTFKNTALIAGMGQNGGGGNTHQGIYIMGNNNLVQYCELDSTGHNGIHFEGDWTVVQKNYVNTFGLTVDDCGGIYTTQSDPTVICNSNSVLNNIVVNGIGVNWGTDDPAYTPAIGIYFDQNTNHTVALNNTTANCAFAGFFSHDANNVTIQNNTFYNNSVEQFLGVRTTNASSNVVFQNNICFSKTATQLATKLQSYNGTNDLPQTGAFTGNYYCRPIDNNYMFYSMYEIGGSGLYNTYNQNLSTWQSSLGLDGGSQTSPATIPSFVASNLSGINLFSNGSFTSNSNGAGVWSPTGDGSANWVTGVLDGGALQISANNYSSNSLYVSMMTNNSVTAGQGYQLSFTLQGAGNGSPVTVSLRQQDAPNGTITNSVIVPVSTNRQDYQFGFTPTTTGRVMIELDIAQPNGAVWVDNVVLQQATLWPTNPNDFIIFAYNPTTSNMHVSMPKGDKFFDATGKQYNNNTVLQPYTSIVLFKQLITQGTTNAVAQQSISLAGGLVDASASSMINSTATKLTWKVDNQDSTASYYEVQRSSDAQSFATIGKATVTTSNSTATTYQYQDASPLAGKSYYRITQRNTKDSVSSTSKTVVVNNISFNINPNPAKDVIHLSFDEMINAADHLDKDVAIRSAAGVTVQTVALPSTDNLNRVDINVTGLQRGVYFLSVSSEGKSFTKKFIKE